MSTERPNPLSAQPRPKHGWLGAVVTVLVGLGVWSLPPLCDVLPDLSYDLAYAFQAAKRPSEVVIVTMDDMFHQKYETRDSQRKAHALLTQRLKEAKARLIVFDVGFTQNSSDPVVDAELARAFRNFGSNRVFVANKVETTDSSTTKETTVIATWPTPTIEAFSGAVIEGAALRALNTVRRFHPEAETPHQRLLVELAAQWEEPSEDFLINYYGPEGSLEHVSYLDVIDQTNLDLQRFKDKAVFVGQGTLSSKVGEIAKNDVHGIPFTLGGTMSGVEIQATAFVNLLRREWVAEASPRANLILILGVGVVFSMVFFHCGPNIMIIAVILGAIAVSALGIGLQLEKHLLVPWIIPSAIQIPLAGLWSWASRWSARDAGRVAEERQATEVPEATAPPIDAGAMIADHRLLKRIGAGSYGEVWLARNPIGQLRAVKTVTQRQRPSASPAVLQREFHGIQRFMPISFNHPGLVRIFHIALSPGGNSFHYVLELADNQGPSGLIDPENYIPRTLRHEIEKRGKIPISECLAWGVALADALSFLHQQELVHRDIKPSNLIFVEGNLKLADVGCVTNQGENVSYIGTQGYMAPEGPGLATADVYSIGMVLYEMLTGFPAARFPELPSSVAETADNDLWVHYNAIMIKCCEEAPEDRFQTAGELSEALGGLLRPS